MEAFGAARSGGTTDSGPQAVGWDMARNLLVPAPMRALAELLMVVVLLAALPARAQTPERKLARGVSGMTLGVLEIPGNMAAETDARGPGEGLPLGFAKGLGMLVERELVGVYEFVTSPFPVPNDYRPIMQPEYPWSYFDGTTTDRMRARPGAVEAKANEPREAQTRPYVPTWHVVSVESKARAAAARRRARSRRASPASETTTASETATGGARP
jgi:putative exosortase-associated protein (TIGR04073 family)